MKQQELPQFRDITQSQAFAGKSLIAVGYSNR